MHSTAVACHRGLATNYLRVASVSLLNVTSDDTKDAHGIAGSVARRICHPPQQAIVKADPANAVFVWNQKPACAKPDSSIALAQAITL